MPLVARRPDDCARNQQAFVCERRRVMLVGHTFVISGAHCLNGLYEKVCMIFRSEKVRRNLAAAVWRQILRCRWCVAAWIMNKETDQYIICFLIWIHYQRRRTCKTMLVVTNARRMFDAPKKNYVKHRDRSRHFLPRGIAASRSRQGRRHSATAHSTAQHNRQR